mmetsp:Transcript_46311/g.76819  ORF Transcript_46311/g.76819 Transcript_46311/m.76819 type:complete len:93 (+) Transcript_46311:3-281(+)
METTSWIDVPIEDKTDFDIAKEFRIINADGHVPGVVMYPIQVAPGFLMFEQSGPTKARVNSHNKGVLLDCKDGNFNNVVWNFPSPLHLQMKR